MLHDFILGFIKIHILHHAEQEPVYGLALIQELQRHGYKVSPGTLYPVLHQLEQQGYLAVEDRVVRGKVRKYYSATAAGSHALIELYLRPVIKKIYKRRFLFTPDFDTQVYEYYWLSKSSVAT